MCVHVCKDNRVCTTSIIRVDNRMDFFFKSSGSEESTCSILQTPN